MLKEKTFHPQGKSLKKHSTAGSDYIDLSSAALEAEFKELSEKLADLQELIYAESKHKVLIVLQGMDTSGKDGIVKHVFSDTNPQGVRVVSFKRPSEIEMRHDYLWRIHKETPQQGELVIFNRSHYEDVIMPTVHKTLSKKRVDERIKDINAFERMLVNEGVTLIKFFLNISRSEQGERITARLANPKKHWKFELSDLKERQSWSHYQKAYGEIIQATHHPDRPWFIIPADNKDLRNYIVSTILVEQLQRLKPQPPIFDAKTLAKIKAEAQAMLKKKK